MAKAAIYARVSTGRQEEEETIQSQLEALKDKIREDHKELAEKHVFSDEGYTGALIDRPALDNLYDALQQDGIDTVYVYDYGRLSRDLTNLMVIKDKIEAGGLQVISLHERITGNPDTDRLLLQIMGAVHEYERKKIAARFHNGKLQKAKHKGIVGHQAPYGYEYDKTTGLFKVLEHEAIVVKQIFHWVAIDGYSTYKVINALYEAGIKPRKAKQDHWTRGPIARMLNNETYIGKHHYNKTESIEPRYRLSKSKYRKQVKTGRRKRPIEEWICNEVPRIISDDLFYKVQKQKKKNSKYNPKNRIHNYLLTGLLYCPCGERRNGDGPHHKKYYRCIGRHKQPDRKTVCAVGGINVEVLDSITWQQLCDLITDKDVIRQHAKRWLTEKTSRNESGKIDKLKHDIKKVKTKQNRFTEAYGKGDEFMPIELYHKKMRETNAMIHTLERELKLASKVASTSVKIGLDELVAKATHQFGELSFKEKKNIVQKVVEKIVATPEEVTIWGQIPTPAQNTNGKVTHVSQYRDCRAA